MILPCATKERLLIQLACLQADVTFHLWDPTKALTAKDVQQTNRSLAIDCVITDRANLAAINACTQNPLRPLKKGLVDEGSTQGYLPVGWHHLKTHANVDSTAYGNHEGRQLVRKVQQDHVDDKVTKYSYSSTSILRPFVTA